jgi:RNA polymerase sigma-70 factor, ECF subfamily
MVRAPHALEDRIRSRFDAGDLRGAITVALDGYGPEIFGFLIGLTRDRDKAGDVFGATCERLWRGLPSFRWGSPFRVWAYAVARNEFLRSLRRRSGEGARVPLSALASELAERVRSTVPAYEQPAVQDAFSRIREQLEPDDHILLGLRIDREMSWPEIARVLGDGEAVERDAATLRKRFERLKQKLRELTREAR